MKFKLEIETGARRLILTPENKGEEQILMALGPAGGPNADGKSEATATVTLECTGRTPYISVNKLSIEL